MNSELQVLTILRAFLHGLRRSFHLKSALNDTWPFWVCAGIGLAYALHAMGI